MGEKKAKLERKDEIVTYFPPIYRLTLGSILFETIIEGEKPGVQFPGILLHPATHIQSRILG